MGDSRISCLDFNGLFPLMHSICRVDSPISPHSSTQSYIQNFMFLIMAIAFAMIVISQKLTI